MSTVLLCDDHRMVRQALADALGREPGITEVYQAGSVDEVLVRYASLQPDCVVMDVHLPGTDGVTGALELLKANPDARVLLLSSEISEDERLRALHGGVKGVVLKEVDETELAAAVSVVCAGGDLLSQTQRRMLQRPRTRTALSPRELQVVTGMAAGQSNAEIARELWLAEDTVKAHAKKLFLKCGVSDRSAAVAWAFRSGVLS